jgi:hypothetical protein
LLQCSFGFDYRQAALPLIAISVAPSIAPIGFYEGRVVLLSQFSETGVDTGGHTVS